MNSDTRRRFLNCGKLKRYSECKNTDFNSSRSYSQSSNSYQKNTSRYSNNNCHNSNYGNFSGTNDDTDCYQAR